MQNIDENLIFSFFEGKKLLQKINENLTHRGKSRKGKKFGQEINIWKNLPDMHIFVLSTCKKIFVKILLIILIKLMSTAQCLHTLLKYNTMLHLPL